MLPDVRWEECAELMNCQQAVDDIPATPVAGEHRKAVSQKGTIASKILILQIKEPLRVVITPCSKQIR